MDNQFTIIHLNGRYYVYTVTHVDGNIYVNIEEERVNEAQVNIAM